MPAFHIANATPGDAPALLALRNHYIAHSFATFDEAPLSLAAIESWMAGFALDGPHRLLVARDGAALLGFCSSQAYRAHPAFARTIETSVYVAPDAASAGVGSALYRRLFDDVAGQGLHRAVVGIALPNEASIRLHARFGFRPVGVFDEYAQKNGRALSSQWMQRAMAGASRAAGPFLLDIARCAPTRPRAHGGYAEPTAARAAFLSKSDTMRVLAIVLIVLGALALVYGGFSYTQDKTAAKIGPIELNVKETKTVPVPMWAGIAGIVIGGVLLVAGTKR